MFERTDCGLKFKAVSISSKIMSKTKYDNKTNKKENHPKSGKSKSDGGPGPSEEKKKARHGKKPNNGGKAKEPLSQEW